MQVFVPEVIYVLEDAERVNFVQKARKERHG